MQAVHATLIQDCHRRRSIQQEDPFHQHVDLNLRKKLIKCYIWCIALCDAETWTLRKVDRNIWEVFKCGAGEEWRISIGLIVCKMTKYYTATQQRNILHGIKRRKANWVGNILGRNCLLKHVIEGRMEVR